MLDSGYDRKHKDYMARFAQLHDAEKKAQLVIVAAWLINIVVNAPTGEVKGFELEQVAHANQDVIDATFNTLMTDDEEG